MTAPVLLREASVVDAPGIARVHVLTWQSAYRGLLAQDFLDSLSVETREQRWRDDLARSGESAFTLVAEKDGRIVGFASGGPERTGDPTYKGEVYAIYILAECQHEGIGRRLIQAAARKLLASGFSSMLIWVFSANPSRTFYEALGGEFVREQPIEIGAQNLVEAGYGWLDISPLSQ